MYKCVFKRVLDFTLALIAAVFLIIPMFLIAIAIVIDDPGPVLFKQNRMGKKKNGQNTYFMIWKFRSMKMSAPQEMPTAQLENPDEYITRVGKFIRKTSLDELPQIYQILTGTMSWIGPRPVLWNEFELLEEREKYGANDVTPGISGWAQINGRDILDAPTKARFDGEYVAALNAGFFSGLAMDVKCFVGTVLAVLRCDDVIEGKVQQQELKEEESRMESQYAYK